MDDQELLERRFADIGAKLNVTHVVRTGRFWDREIGGAERRTITAPFSVDIRRGRFIVNVPDDVEVKVLDVRPKERHLVLHATDPTQNTTGRRFLCGHDERDWFVAAVPGAITTVQQARDSLKPEEVRNREKGLKRQKRNRRRNAASIRQGEWFFTPAPEFGPPDDSVLHNEPIARMRGGRMAGTPHMCEELCRVGGHAVYQFAGSWSFRSTSERDADSEAASIRRDLPDHPLSISERREFGRKHPDVDEDKFWRIWTTGMDVYARGAVRHPDHATVVLKGWHRVHGNTEAAAPGHSAVIFVD